MLRVEHIAKSFGPVTALRDVSLHLKKGEVLGLLGDNGAGKSTLIKILCGFQKQDAGTMWLKGEPYEPKSVENARTLGIDVVYQDLALIDDLSVYENMFLCREQRRGRLPFLDKRRMKKESRAGRSTTSASTCRDSMCPSRASPAGSASRSPWRAASTPRPTSCCSTSRSRRWAPRRAR